MGLPRRIIQVPIMLQWLWLLALLGFVSSEGEMARWTEPQMTPNVNHRQNVCDRFQSTMNGTVDMMNALAGMELNILVAKGDYFFYDDETGIAKYPGLAAVLLDEIAKRAGFSWRNSFAASRAPTGANESWTDLLLWGIDSYDVNADWWAQNLDRMNQGAVFLEEWYDGSIILITKKVPEVVSDEIVWTNWMLPYKPEVWALTIFTIFLSGVVYQLIEWLADDRQERSFWQWWQENFYLSAINFTQAYEYQPKNMAGRLFGISMALWALVMTATYTANLASLYVDRKPQMVQVDNVEQAAVFGYRICTWENTNSDLYIKDTYPSANRIPKKDIQEVYDGLHSGECHYAVEVVTSWEQSRRIRSFNPTCDLEWVGEPLYKIKEVGAGFASKADSGDLCTNLVRDVINLHMEAMKTDGFIEQAWEEAYNRQQNINCDVYDPELEAAAGITTEAVLSDGDIALDDMMMTNDTDLMLIEATILPAETTMPPAGETTTPPEDESPLTRQRRLGRTSASYEQPHTRQHHRAHRTLKAAGKGAVGGAVASKGDSTSEGGEQLTMNQMIGTFLFHWVVMAFALFISFYNWWYNKYIRKPIIKPALQKMKTMRNLNRTVTNNTARCSLDTRECSTDDREATEGGREDTSVFAIGRVDAATNSSRTSGIVDQVAFDALSQEVMTMRRSQATMEEYQRQLLQEQRNMQLQIQALLKAAGHDPGLFASSSNNNQQQQQQRTSSYPPSRITTISAVKGTISDDDDGTVELFMPLP